MTENRSVGGSIPPLGTIEPIELTQEILLAAFRFVFRLIFVATSLQPERKKSANGYVVPKTARVCTPKRSRTVGCETVLSLPPEPTSVISAEALERPIRKEDLDAGARHRVDIEHKRVLMPTIHTHASVGSASANPRK